MTNDQIIAQLLAIRASVDAMLALLAPEEPEDGGGECNHPPQVRQDLSTMGIERWQCKLCGYLFERKTGGGE